MKTLRFHYHMDIVFDGPIYDHRFTLKCIPHSDEQQTITDLLVDVYPNQFIRKGLDSFQNVTLYGYAKDAHQQFYIDIQGIACVYSHATRGKESIYTVGLYKYQTKITSPGPKLLEYFSTFTFENTLSNYDKALIMMHDLFSHFHYMQGITSIETSAEAAFKLGKGVCQDYAHILLSLCRMAKIPCRYVVGLLMGEGYSHAWVEIFQLDLINSEQGSWIALDPTNNLIVSDQHIKISSGRDCNDCKMNQGLFTGNGNQSQNITVIVYEHTKNNSTMLTEEL